MDIIYADYETFWSVTHSLSKMNPITYVMHPETEIQSVALAINDGPIDVLFGEDEIRYAFSQIDWSRAMCVAHNGSGFDHLLTRWRFGLKPAAWGCTLAMARPFYGLTHRLGLGHLAQAMGLGAKGSLEEVNTKGKKLADFTREELAKMRVYNKQDTHLCREIFKRLAPRLGTKELKLIDLTVRMTVDPQLEADVPLLGQALATEITRKHQALLHLAHVAGVYQNGMTLEQAAAAMRPIVMSQPQFAGLLNQFGAPIPMKESPKAKDADGNPKLIPALAKTDEGMTDLLEYEDPDGDEAKTYAVRVAAATRLETKSTQLETRLKTYIDVAAACNGKMPMPVNYNGAIITWRMSGNMNMNVQNNPRVIPDDPKPSDALRASLVAPEGKIIVVVDSSNIELRVAHWLAGEVETLEKLRNKEDLYCWFAGTMYGREITKSDKLERYLGKQAMLQLQFGAGAGSFQKTARVNSKGKVNLEMGEAKRVVNVWRGMFPHIADNREGIWKLCDVAITAMASGQRMCVDSIGLCHTENERIVTPDGHWISYANLRKTMKVEDGKAKDSWVYGEGRNKAYIYGAKVFANMTQHIARLIVMDQTLKLDRRYPVALSCHDEAVMVVDEDQGEACKQYALEVFSTGPKWATGLPLAAEADMAYSYADAK